MDWDKLGDQMEKSRLEREAEAARLAVDPGPALDAKPTGRMHDWTKSIGVLYGTPARVGGGWGVAIYPTRQQEALLEVARNRYDETGRYDDGYLKGLEAVSIDKNGRERTLTITEPRGFMHDMSGNAYCRCGTEPRTPERSTRTPGGGPGGPNTHGGPPARRQVQLEDTAPEPAEAPSPTTAITAQHYTDEPGKAPETEVDEAYFHLVEGKEPWPIGETEKPPANARVWTAEDWFDIPADRMFTNYVGDCQPRHADGGILRTTERMAIHAACTRSGMTANNAWTGLAPGADDDVVWVASPDGNGAMRTGPCAEEPQHQAMRDLPGKDGYGRARGTEEIDRPSQAARVRALALHVSEVAQASGIELRREDRPSAPRDGVPRIACYADGGMRVTLGAGVHDRPSTPDLVEETTAIAIARAYARGDDHPQRWQRAVVAGIIAGHHLVQTAGIRTLATTHETTVAAWRDAQKSQDPEAARQERAAVVRLARTTEWDLALPRTERQFRRWDRLVHDRQQRTRGRERPAASHDRGRGERQHGRSRPLQQGVPHPARPNSAGRRVDHSRRQRGTRHPTCRVRSGARRRAQGAGREAIRNQPVIHPTASVSPDATVKRDAVIGPRATVAPGAWVRSGGAVAEGGTVRDNAVVEYKATVGKGAELGSNSTLEMGATMLDRSKTGQACRIDC